MTVDGQSVVTDATGYYKLAVSPGVKTVEISKGNEYFVSEDTDVAVSRNNSTVVNTDLVAVDTKKLLFTGTVLDSKDAKAVKDATVVLQSKNADGKFQFANNAATTSVTGTALEQSPSVSENVLEVGKEYRAVVEKKVSADNLTSVYKKQEVTFTVSNKKPETTKIFNADKVAELKSLTIDASVAKDLTLDTAGVEVDFLNTDGDVDNVLESFKLLEASGQTANDFTLENDKFKEGVEVVSTNAKFANGTADPATASVKPRLVSGTYFMLVKNANTATKAYAVEVTEGGDAKVKFEFEAPQTAQAKTIVDKVQYKHSLANAPEATPPAYQTSASLALTQLNETAARINGSPIEASYAAYQTVAGVDIKIAKTASGSPVKANFDASSNVTDVTAAGVPLNNLAASVTYKVKSTSDFLVGDKDLTVKPDAATNNVTANVQTSTKLDKIKLTDKKGKAITTSVKVKSLKLVNDEGKTVVEASPEATNATVTPSNGIVNISDFGTEFAKEFTGIKADKYKLTVELASGYKEGTSVETDLIDFQNAQVTVALEAIETVEPKVTGYVRYTDGTSVADTTDNNGAQGTLDTALQTLNVKKEALETAKAELAAGTKTQADVDTAQADVDTAHADVDTAQAAANKQAEASVVAYDEKGDAVASTNFGQDAETTYSLTGLTAGKEYTFVVRGEGFETKAVKKTVSKDEITNLNFDVVKGGNGQFKLQIVDTKDNVLPSAAADDMEATDAYYDEDTTVAFDGSYDVEGPTASTGTASRSYTIDSVSVGSYTLVLKDQNTTNGLDDTKYVLPQTYTLTLANINGTSYATSQGDEIIKVPLKDGDSGSLDVALNLTFTGTATTNATNTADIDYIQVLDKDGNIVETKRGNNVSQLYFNGTGDNATTTIKVPNNATYTIKTYLDNGFVSTDTVTVQNNDVKKTINVEQSER